MSKFILNCLTSLNDKTYYGQILKQYQIIRLNIPLVKSVNFSSHITTSMLDVVVSGLMPDNFNDVNFDSITALIKNINELGRETNVIDTRINTDNSLDMNQRSIYLKLCINSLMSSHYLSHYHQRQTANRNVTLIS